MSAIILEVEIDHGKIVALEPEKLPPTGKGRLIIEPAEPALRAPDAPAGPGKRVRFPIIHTGDGFKINPTPDQLETSFWGDDQAG